MAKKKKSKGGGFLWWLIFLITLGILGFSGYKLAMILLEYRQADQEYAKLERFVEKKKVGDKAAGEKQEEEEAVDPGPQIDWKSLKSVNKDVVGWLVVDALDISYPIMQGEDNDFYLHRTTEKTYNFAGSIFLDYENKANFQDPNSIVYGHNMRDKSMFGKLKWFREEEYYAKSMYFWICTPEKNYRYEIFSAYESAVGSETYTLFKGFGKEYSDYQSHMPKLSEIPARSIPFKGKEHIVTLSTCTSNSATRFVVQGVRVEDLQEP